MSEFYSRYAPNTKRLSEEDLALMKVAEKERNKHRWESFEHEGRELMFVRMKPAGVHPHDTHLWSCFVVDVNDTSESETEFVTGRITAEDYEAQKNELFSM